ncbi:MAG: nitroreductase family protein [Treponema sp.]|nr:nitroreductase family protein [Treponema sp.]
MNVSLDAIHRRISVRTYDSAPLEPAAAAALRASFLEAVPGPFGGRPRFLLLERGEDGAEGRRLGTYGQIRDAPAFIVGAVERGPRAMEDYGYALEGIVLKATELGLGSCWLGGLFDRTFISHALAADDAEVIPACCPVGTPASRIGVQDRIIRLGAGSRRRKDPAELFFEHGADGSWQALRAEGKLAELLEAVRIGPSASNKQPWRLLFDRSADRLCLFLREDRLYNAALGEIKLQNLDMGIAMRHIESAATALGLRGSWSLAGDAPRSPDERLRYIAAWQFA